MREALFVAYHYPPAYGSGVHRTLAFARYLPRSGWRARVLSIRTSAYDAVQPEVQACDDEEPEVMRAFGFDSARWLSVRGRYAQWTALPDRWVSWWFDAVRVGWAAIRARRPEILYSTFPIATAHLIALTLHRLTGVPWVADFRDPMAQDEYPKNRLVWRTHRRIEEWTVRRAARVIFNTPGALDYYRARYPDVPAHRWRLIANGYDEAAFAALEPGHRPHGGARITLLHSGLLYPWERDPQPFFNAVARLRDDGFFNRYPATLVFRGSGFDAHFKPLVADLGLDSLVEFRPPCGYRDALGEMLSADGLLLFQAANSNFQIPVKAYEYLRAGRPILTIADPMGDTAGLMRSAGMTDIAPIDDAVAIGAGLRRFVEGIARHEGCVPRAELVAQHARHHGAAALATLFDECLAESAVAHGAPVRTGASD